MHPALGSSRPLVFAHRGGSKLAPENTMTAFDRGMAAGADGLELDVHLSRDGVVVVHHDRSLDRTTRAHGPRGAIARPPSWPRSTCPRLRDVLARYPTTAVIVELKERRPDLARAVVRRGPPRRSRGARLPGVVQRWRRCAQARAMAPEIATSGAASRCGWRSIARG